MDCNEKFPTKNLRLFPCKFFLLIISQIFIVKIAFLKTAYSGLPQIESLTTYDHIWPHLTTNDRIWSHMTESDHLFFVFFFNFFINKIIILIFLQIWHWVFKKNFAYYFLRKGDVCCYIKKCLMVLKSKLDGFESPKFYFK